jgi:hypothetical protein
VALHARKMRSKMPFGRLVKLFRETGEALLLFLLVRIIGSQRTSTTRARVVASLSVDTLFVSKVLFGRLAMLFRETGAPLRPPLPLRLPLVCLFVQLIANARR